MNPRGHARLADISAILKALPHRYPFHGRRIINMHNDELPLNGNVTSTSRSSRSFSGNCVSGS
jgi:hypothetical protein